MKIRYIFFYLVAVSHLSVVAQKNMAFINGNVFDGKTFEKKDFYAVDGKISFNKPKSVDSTINLSNKFVIPPFGDAHTHNLDREWQMSFLPKQYLNEGTFYVLNLTSKLDGVRKLSAYYAKKNTVDVRFSHQGLTSTLGHPFLAYEPYEMGMNDAEWEIYMDSIKASRLDENNAYIFIDSKEDVKRKMQPFFKERPAVVKIFLLNSQDYERNFTNNIAGDHGLSVPVAKAIVKESHKSGLKVYAHIESAADFVEGVKMGVDYFAHMPGYDWDGEQETLERYFISDHILKKAVKQNIGIIPTVGWALRSAKKDSLGKVEFVKDFLTRFHDYGGKLYVGSDYFNRTASEERDLMINLDVFSNLTLLKIFSAETPQIIFPDRKIGALIENYEASFLVLNANPIESIQAIRNIHLRVKQGIIIK